MRKIIKIWLLSIIFATILVNCLMQLFIFIVLNLGINVMIYECNIYLRFLELILCSIGLIGLIIWYRKTLMVIIEE